MNVTARFEEHRGIRCVLAEDAKWPSPANFYLIPQGSGFAMIDVGCGGPDGAGYLKAALAHWQLEPADCTKVVLSHAHPDHMGAMAWFLERSQPEVFIHQLDVKGATQPSHLNTTFDIPLAVAACTGHPGFEGLSGLDILDYFSGTGCWMGAAPGVAAVEEGDCLEIGDFCFEVLHTPGHSPGHIALFDREKGLLLPGDMVGAIPAWYTPASGGLMGYLASLDKLAAAEADWMLPAHGPVIHNPGEAVAWVRGKLMNRENKILEALGRGERSFMELNALLFPTPFVQFFPGCGILESHLQKLENEGRIERPAGNDRIVVC